ncbi:MAG: hypothetical protein IJY17_06515, partial [Alphaproteobacteria bacterium]|nr:hypothetical protein [Alphaproteobacteria bacterium]
CQYDTFSGGYGTGKGPATDYPPITIMQGFDNNPALCYNEDLAEVYRDWIKENPVQTGGWGTWPANHPEMPVSDELAASAAKVSDTAIVVIGDHLARRNPLYDTLEKSENRFIFNRFVNINLPVSTERSFSMLDLGATLLEMLGFVLPQKGLGLGRSLLSSQEPTLIEKYGIEHIHGEILKNSAFYKKLLKEQHIDQPGNKKGQ